MTLKLKNTHPCKINILFAQNLKGITTFTLLQSQYSAKYKII